MLKDSLRLPLLSCELWMFVKGNPNRKKKTIFFLRSLIPFWLHTYLGSTYSQVVFKYNESVQYCRVNDWMWLLSPVYKFLLSEKPVYKFKLLPGNIKLFFVSCRRWNFNTISTLPLLKTKPSDYSNYITGKITAMD